MTDADFDKLMQALRHKQGFASLTPEEAQRAYDEAEPVLLSPERIQEIVDFAVGFDAGIYDKWYSWAHRACCTGTRYRILFSRLCRSPAAERHWRRKG